MTGQAIGRKPRGKDERRRALTVSLAPELIDKLDSLREFSGQYRSEIIGRLIVEAARRREGAGES